MVQTVMLMEIVVFPGVDELDALGPMGADFQTRLVSLDGAEQVKGAYGLRFSVDGHLGSAGRLDLLLIPGGGWVARSTQGAWAEAQRGAIRAALATANKAGTILASVCTGAMLIAAAGLLRGRHAVTHQGALEDLRASGANVVPARVVDDGDILTSGGATSGIDLAVHLVERFAGAKVAEQVAKELEYERRGPAYAGANRQSALTNDESRVT